MQYPHITFGKGKRTVLFLHGLAGGKENALGLLKYLSKNFKIIALDLPHHNGNPDKVRYDVNDSVKYVERFVIEKKLKDFYLIGFSMGGNLALNFVNDKRIKKVVVWASPLCVNSEPKITLTAKTLLFLMRVIPYQFFQFVLENIITPKLLSKFGVMLSNEDVKQIVKFDNRAGITYSKLFHEEISVLPKGKVMGIFGNKDVLINPYSKKDQEFLNSKNMQVKIIKNGGHFGSEKSIKEVNQEILKFFE